MLVVWCCARMASSIRTGARFAVKRIADDARVTAQQRQAAEQSMLRELEVLRTARHPHMIRLLGYCVPGK